MVAAVDIVRNDEDYGYTVFDKGSESADVQFGNAGDLLKRVLVTDSSSGSSLDIYDGDVATGTLVLSIPTSAGAGTTYELRIKAKTNWTADYTANGGAVLLIGHFTV